MAIEIRKPRASSLNDTRVLAEYLNDIAERTGGDTDLIEQALSQSQAALDAAETAQTTANVAEANAQSAAVLGQQGIDDAATAQAAADDAQADANDVWLSGFIDDIAAITASGRVSMVAPCAGTITKVYVTLNDATSGGDAIIAPSINVVSITGGNVTVPDASSAGDIISSTPSALNVVAEGDLILAVSNGGGSSTCKAHILMKITRA